MKTHEIDALLTYVEFHLVNLIEETEKHVFDLDVIGDMYDRAYAMLNDLETTLTIQTQLESKVPLSNNK